MIRAALAAILADVALAGAAAAVGFGPMAIDGTIDGPREGFTLNLLNPYDTPTDFIVYAVGETDEVAQSRVSILPAETTLGSLRGRKILVIADELTTGETYRFRVCAERKTPSDGVSVHARVCSKLSARRVG